MSEYTDKHMTYYSNAELYQRMLEAHRTYYKASNQKESDKAWTEYMALHNEWTFRGCPEE